MLQHTPAIATRRGRQWNTFQYDKYGVTESNPVHQGLHRGNPETFDLEVASS